MKEKDICNFWSTKYYVISLVLDILVRRMVTNNITNVKEVEMSYQELLEKVWSYSTHTMEWGLSQAKVELIVTEMFWMNLIEKTDEISRDNYVRLTEEGVEAYKDQRFHSIAASSMLANESRKLAVKALVISIGALIVSVIFSILPLFYK